MVNVTEKGEPPADDVYRVHRSEARVGLVSEDSHEIFLVYRKIVTRLNV